MLAGGLAAPALAAVAGSVATTIGGSAAAATAVTGMMGSSVGAASMIAGFGYYGGRVTADHMARRIGMTCVLHTSACDIELPAWLLGLATVEAVSLPTTWPAAWCGQQQA